MLSSTGAANTPQSMMSSDAFQNFWGMIGVRLCPGVLNGGQ